LAICSSLCLALPAMGLVDSFAGFGSCSVTMPSFQWWLVVRCRGYTYFHFRWCLRVLAVDCFLTYDCCSGLVVFLLSYSLIVFKSIEICKFSSVMFASNASGRCLISVSILLIDFRLLVISSSPLLDVGLYGSKESWMFVV
jgi:hypothetical protein